MISTYSRVRASGLPNGWPYQPSTTCGPDTPRPRISRPLLRWSSVSVCIAVAVGVRAEICTTPVPSLIVDVCAAIHTSGENASEPHDSALHTESKPSFSASCASSAIFARRPRAPVPENESELHVAPALRRLRACPAGYFTGMCLMPAMKFERSGCDVADELERRDPARHLLEQHVDLHAGEVRAEAVVRTAAAEADVLVRVARDVERERVVEHVLVAVRGDVPDADLVAGLDLPGRGARCPW